MGSSFRKCFLLRHLPNRGYPRHGKLGERDQTRMGILEENIGLGSIGHRKLHGESERGGWAYCILYIYSHGAGGRKQEARAQRTWMCCWNVEKYPRRQDHGQVDNRTQMKAAHRFFISPCSLTWCGSRCKDAVANYVMVTSKICLSQFDSCWRLGSRDVSGGCRLGGVLRCVCVC